MVATTQNITAEQGAALSVSLVGSAGTLTGRTLLMHVRSKVGVITIKLAASTTGGEITITGTNAATLAIGSDVMAAVSVTNATEYWVYDVESYTDATDIRREWAGSFTITRDVTRATEPDSEDSLAGLVRYDTPQALTSAQQLQARDNIGAGTGGGGGGSGDVVGPASATDDRIAAFDSTTGKLIKQGSVTATAVASHLGSTSNPHSVTAAQAGADPAGTASSAVSAHAGATDPHGDRAYADGLAGNYQPLATVLTNTTAAFTTAQETKLSGIETAADVTDAANVTAAGALMDSEVTNLAQVKAFSAADYATAAQGTDDRTASGMRTATTVVAVSSATAPSSGQVLTATSSTAANWQTPSGGTSNIRDILAGELIPRVTTGGGIDGEELTTNKVNIDYIAFDPATIEFAQYGCPWPGSYTTFTATFYWTGASGSGAVRLRASAVCCADDAALDAAQGTVQGVTDTYLAAADAHKSAATSAITPAGTVADGNWTVFEFSRDPTHGDDNYSVDCRVKGIRLEFAA